MLVDDDFLADTSCPCLKSFAPGLLCRKGRNVVVTVAVQVCTDVPQSVCALTH